MRVRISFEGDDRDVEALDTAEVQSVLSSLDLAQAPTRIFDLTGGYFVEPGDLLCDVCSEGDLLWVTLSDRWLQCKSLVLERSRSGGRVAKGRRVLCNHSKGDPRACSMCGMIRTMIQMEVSSAAEKAARYRGDTPPQPPHNHADNEPAPTTKPTMRPIKPSATHPRAPTAAGNDVKANLPPKGPPESASSSLSKRRATTGQASRDSTTTARVPSASSGRRGSGMTIKHQISLDEINDMLRAEQEELERHSASSSTHTNDNEPLPPPPPPQTLPTPAAMTPPAPVLESAVAPPALTQAIATVAAQPPPARRVIAEKAKPVAPTPTPQQRTSPGLSSMFPPADPSPPPPPPPPATTPPPPSQQHPHDHHDNQQQQQQPRRHSPRPHSPAAVVSFVLPTSDAVPASAEAGGSGSEGQQSPPVVIDAPSPTPESVGEGEEWWELAAEEEEHEEGAGGGLKKKVWGVDCCCGDDTASRAYVDTSVQDYVLHFAQHFYRPLRQHVKHFRPSDADLLIWSVFQSSARRGALGHHVRQVATEMTLSQARALCYDMGLVAYSFTPGATTQAGSPSQRHSASTSTTRAPGEAAESKAATEGSSPLQVTATAMTGTSAAVPSLGLRPQVIGDLFHRAMGFVDVIGVGTELQASHPRALSILRSFWMSSTIRADKMRPSLNFIEFIYFLLQVALTTRDRSSSGGNDPAPDSPVRQPSLGRRTSMASQGTSSPGGGSEEGEEGPRFGGLLGIILSVHGKHENDYAKAFEAFMEHFLLPLMAEMGRMTEARHQRLGIAAKPASGHSDVRRISLELKKLTAACGTTVMTQNMRQLQAIFHHFSEVSAAPDLSQSISILYKSTQYSSAALTITGKPATRRGTWGTRSLNVKFGREDQLRLTGLRLIAATETDTLVDSRASVYKTPNRSGSPARNASTNSDTASPTRTRVGVAEKPRYMSLEQLVRFGKTFKLLPQLVDLEELGSLYRDTQEVEWLSWLQQKDSEHMTGLPPLPLRLQRATKVKGEVDMRALIKTGRLITPTRNAEMGISFEGFLSVLLGIAQAGFAAEHQASPPLAYLLQYMDNSGGKECLRQLFQYVVRRPFELRGPSLAETTSSLSQTVLAMRTRGLGDSIGK